MAWRRISCVPALSKPPTALTLFNPPPEAAAVDDTVCIDLLCTRTVQHIGKRNLIRQVFKPIIRRANDAAKSAAAKAQTEAALLPDFRFHDLRHTHATILLVRGHSIKAVSQRLGHRDINITLKVYAHVLPTDDGMLADGLQRMLA